MDSAPPRATGDAATWHHGLVARWWALFRHDGPEIDFFRRYVEAGEPALDVACGTGRLLVPYRRAGLDVDGVDVSADMIDHCRAAVLDGAAETAEASGLYVQAACELDVPRVYATIFMCGGFGVGTVADQDALGLRRILMHLRPGGTFVMDAEVTDGWPPPRRPGPDPDRPDPPRPERRQVGADGDEYALRQRVLAVDDREVRREIRVWRWRDDELIADERHELTYVVHHPDEIVAMLDAAGFGDIRVIGGYDGAPPTPAHQFLVYEARAPAARAAASTRST